ncbi:MAG: hypothetical protein QM503_08785 [Bacteroidota bacterium]
MDNTQLTQAEKHIKNAWIAGAVSASFTLILSLIGAYNDDIRFKYGFDTWTLLDVALIAGLTYGIYRKNRYCALGLLIYFIVSKFAMAASTGQFPGGFISLLFAYFFFQGTRATFQIHKHKIDNREILIERSKKGLGYYIGISLGSLIILGIGSLMVIGSLSPEIEVIPGKQVNKKYLNFVWEQGIVDRSEDIQYWYSDAIIDFKAGFYLFTNRKVVVYCKEWEDPAIIIPYSQIVDIEFEQDPSFFVDSRITLILIDSSTVYFPVSSDNGGDKKYHDRLVKMWNAD